MNKKQLEVVNKIIKDFEEAGRLGLSAGIFDGAICFWPAGKTPTPGTTEFWNELESVGGINITPDGIWLDGGTGI